MTRIEGRTSNAPRPAGPYSQVTRIGAIVAVAGQVGTDPTTGSLSSDDVSAQTAQAFRNVAAALSALGCGLDDIVRVDVFLASMEDFQAMNEAYELVFSPPYPARTTVGVSLAPGVKVEITVLAVSPGSE